jgi:serine/threonine-protein kinase
MTTAFVTDFLEVLRSSQLLEPAQLEEVSRETSAGTNPELLTQRLVQRSWLTPYQAEQLLRADGQGLVLGPYRLLEPIGEGGMGQVFKAVHHRLQRVVALKVIHPGRLTQEPETIHRFQREARAAALMAHPNVVMVYDAEQVGDTYYIALEYVDGTDLAKLVKQNGPLPIAQACEYIRQAALGLQHAHEHGMVHRDIKPSNLLVTRQTAARPGITSLRSPSRSAAEGPELVKILDMGLVRMVQEAEGASHASLTQEGTVMGTPDYIAPEQARDAHKVDIRADLYSLGCTFYFLLTGQVPFPEGTVIEKLLMHQLDEPRLVEKSRPELPPGVAMIVRKLMAKRCDDRFQTPAALVTALDRVTPHKRVVVPAPAPVVLPLPASSADTARDAKTLQVTAIVPAKPAPAPEPPAPAGPAGPQLLTVLKGHTGCVMAAAFTLDRDTLAAGGVDGSVRLWDFSAGKPRERAVLTPHMAPPRPTTARTLLRISERTLASAPGSGVHALAIASNGRLMATGSGGMDGLVRLWQLTTDRPSEKAVLGGHRMPVDALAFSPDGKLLASGGSDRLVRLWDLSATPPRERSLLRGHTNVVKAVAFTPDSQYLVSGGMDGTIRLWHTSNRLWGREQAVLRGHDGSVNAVAFAPDGRTLVTGGQDQAVRLWDLSGRPEERLALGGHKGAVRLVMFRPDGNTLISVDDRGQVNQWDVAAAQRTREWQLPGSQVYSVALTFDGRYLAAGSTDGKVSVFRLGDKRNAE